MEESVQTKEPWGDDQLSYRLHKLATTLLCWHRDLPCAASLLRHQSIDINEKIGIGLYWRRSMAGGRSCPASKATCINISTAAIQHIDHGDSARQPAASGLWCLSMRRAETMLLTYPVHSTYLPFEQATRSWASREIACRNSLRTPFLSEGFGL
jgi:hypothetical protein